MTLDPQDLFYALVAIIYGVAIYLITKSNNHEKRIQKQEDVTTSQVADLREDIREMKKEFREVNEKLENLRLMVHKEKNTENQLNVTLGLILKKLSHENN